MFTRALEVLVSRGHNLRLLLHEYPVDLVFNLHQAALENQRTELKTHTLGVSVAVMNAIDTALGDGKGKIMEKWLQVVDGVSPNKPERSQRRVSPQALAFLGGLPKRIKVDS